MKTFVRYLPLLLLAIAWEATARCARTITIWWMSLS